ncbi:MULTISPECIES: extracellular solute-binding protein [unclassified Microbacterium]|uniref:extracellular solute-binding protein n=1 Tax=unclassified Microbacterium TaxID=2609290 RepID=UPI0012FCB491|nr:extracellular solute-binding protein [Microbacterium sp. MAH-37]MVQ43852.1 extracellular solute-binding protein [Microbacterium sp. MAH-37]
MAVETTRRTFLSLTAISALGLVAAGTLTGCGTQGSLKASGVTEDVLPSYIPLKGVSPDLAPKAAGAPAGFFSYPSSPFRSVATAPLKGDSITAMTLTYLPPSTPMKSNPAWKEVNERLGGTLEIDAVGAADYDTKLNTAIAGNNLPDLMLNSGTAIPDIIGFLESSCADLTPFLAGDKAKAYPNLANIPTAFWREGVQNGKLFLIPIPRNQTGGAGLYNKGLWDKAGITDISSITTVDDFLAAMKALTSPAAKQWALGSVEFGGPFSNIYKVPYNWEEKGGKLTKSFETDRYLESLGLAEKANKLGYFVPGSGGWEVSQQKDAFTSGKVALSYDGLTAYPGPTGYATLLPLTDPSFEALPYIPFGYDGGDGTVPLNAVTFGTVMVKKGGKAHIRKVLEVANFLAAPFGTEEYLLMNYGAADVDYTLDGSGNPQPTSAAALDVTVPFKYLAAPQQAVYDPSSKNTVKVLFDAYEKLIPMGVTDPTRGLFSPTDATRGSSLAQPVNDAALNFIAGRGTLADVKAAIKTWRTSGGDKIRKEYEDLLSDSSK